jgi:membrane protein
MPSLKERVSAKAARFRARHQVVDHSLNTVTHYGSVNGNAQAGAVTYFGFLSFFPILALGFFFVGLLAQVYPELRADIHVEIENLLPGVVGSDEGEIPMKTFEDYAATVGLFGLIGVLYSGLGWLSGMRAALEVMFVLPVREHPNFVVGKLRDLGTLVLIGLVLVVSVALSGLVSGFSERILEWLGLDPSAPAPYFVLWVIGHGLAIAASTVLLLAMFRLLAQPHVPRRSLLGGAVLGAFGFEVLKSAAGFLISLTKGQPAFQAFGVALILLIWINYFSRLVMYAAAFAYTSPEAVDLRARESMRAPGAAFGNVEEGQDRPVDVRVPSEPDPLDRVPAPLAPPAPSPLVPVSDELALRGVGSHRAEPASGTRRVAGVAAAGLLVAGGAAVVAWRRSTR